MIDPFFIPVLCLTAGMLVGGWVFFLGFIPVFACVYLIVIEIINRFLIPKQEQFRVSRFIVFGLFFLVGFYLLQSSLYTRAPDDISRLIDGKIKYLEGMVCDEVQINRNSAQVVLDNVVDCSGDQKIPMTGQVRLSVGYEEEKEKERIISQLKRGTIVEFQSRLDNFSSYKNFNSFDASLYYAAKGIKARAYVSHISKLTVGGTNSKFSFLEIFHRYRNHIKTELLSWSDQHPFNDDYRKVSAFLVALLLGDRSELDEDIRDAFRQTGLFHILAISGLHVGILAGLFYLPLMFIFKERLRFRAAIMIGIMLFYVLLTSAQPSVLRASVMLIIYLIGIILFRESRLLNTISIAALLLLIYQPLYIFQTGFQLTFLAVLSIYFLTEQIQLNVLPTLAKTTVGSVIAISLAVQVGMAPVLAYLFSMVPVLSFIPFLIVLPILTTILLLGFLFVVIISISTGIAHIVLYPLHFLTFLLLEIINRFADLPLNTVVTGQPSIWLILTYYAILLFAIHPFVRPRVYRWLRYPLLGLFLLVFAVPPLYKYFKPQLEVTFLDVGDGDSALINLPNGQVMLIDGGGTEQNRFDTARYILFPVFLKKRIMQLDQVLPTHAHADHIQGITNLIPKFPVRQAYISYRKHQPELYQEYIRLVRENSISVIPLHLIPDKPLLSINENNHSAVIKIRYGDFSVLFTGDIEKEAEESLLKYGHDLHSTVLKVAHHGSRTSSIEPFLRLVDADFAVVSSSGTNIHGHPHREVLHRLATVMRPCPIYITGKKGAVSVSSDGGKDFLVNGTRL